MINMKYYLELLCYYAKWCVVVFVVGVLAIVMLLGALLIVGAAFGFSPLWLLLFLLYPIPITVIHIVCEWSSKIHDPTKFR